jgi:two-component system, sensor histidine kinase and response regulator
MDLNMPGRGGLDATRAIRFWESSSYGPGFRVPIIGLSGELDPDVESQCYRAGMDAFLPKPFSLADIRSLLRKYSLPLSSL